MSRPVRILILVGVMTAYAALLVAALAPAPLAFTVVLAIVLGGEVVLATRYPYALPEVVTTQLGVRFRTLSADVLAVVLAARAVLDDSVIAAAVIAIIALHGSRDLSGVLARRAGWLRAGGPVSWRNLTVAGLPAPRPVITERPINRGLTATSLVVPLGATVAVITGSAFPLLVAAAAVVLIAVVVLAVWTVEWRLASTGSKEAVRRAVRAAIVDVAPEVVLHFSGRRRTTDQVEMWASTLRWLRQSSLILVREASHLEQLEGVGVPVVFAPLSTDVEFFSIDSVQVVLYATNTANINNHQLRVPGIFDVFIGAGDSDEPHNSSPISRMYDEVWVAGPLGRERYRNLLTGVRDDHVREIGGLPLVARATRPVPMPTTGSAGRTVLYAPSWEGVSERADLSSLPIAERLLTALLALPDVRVLYAPPVAAGTRLPAFAGFDERARRLVALAGGEHAVLDRGAVAGELAHATLVLCDIGPIVADAVALDTAYAIPVHPGSTETAMRDAFPTLAAGAVLSSTFDNLADLVDDAAGADQRSDARAILRQRIFGRGADDFQQRFQAAIDDAIAQQGQRRSHSRPTIPA